MKRSKRLEPVRDLMEQAERKSAVRVSSVQGRLAEAERSHAELQRYMHEYQQAFKTRASAGIGVNSVRDYQTFIARLGEAMQQQVLLITQLRTECELERKHWTEAAVRKTAVGKVIAQALVEDKRIEDRRLQNETDERAHHRAGGQ